MKCVCRRSREISAAAFAALVGAGFGEGAAAATTCGTLRGAGAGAGAVCAAAEALELCDACEPASMFFNPPTLLDAPRVPDALSVFDRPDVPGVPECFRVQPRLADQLLRDPE